MDFLPFKTSVDGATKRLLAIGVDDYPGILQTRGCVNDVNLLSDVLEARYGFKASRINRLLNSDANRNGILIAFAELAQEARAGDSVVLFFSGQGYRRRIGGPNVSSGLLPYDCHSAEKMGRLITSQEIEQFVLGVAESANVTVILDCSYSGKAEDLGGSDSCSIIEPQGKIDWASRNPNPANALGKRGAQELSTVNPMFTMMTSCRDDEHAREFMEPNTGKSYGVFTYYFCRELANASARGTTLRGIFQQVQESVVARVPTQHPMLLSQPISVNTGNYPRSLVEAIDAISTRLIRYLKANPQEMRRLRPRQFEELIAEILASYGWKVELTAATRDGGYDIFAISRDRAGVNTSWIVECKRYSENRKIGVDLVRSLLGVKTVFPAANMLVATTSYFSRNAQQFKESRYDLELKDYDGILDWIGEYQPISNRRLHSDENRL